MKKLVTAAMAVALVISASAAQAQDPGDLGVFGDEAGTLSTLAFPGGQATVYVVGFGLDETNISAYEIGVRGIEEAGISVFGNIGLFPATAIRAGVGGAFDFVVSTAGCIPGSGPATMLVSIPLATFAAVASDVPVCVTGAGVASTTPNGLPGFAECDPVSGAQELVEFGVAQNGEDRYPSGCLILNATLDGPVDTETSSFGEIKARF